MKIVLITGSAGLVGSEAVSFFTKKFNKIVGIDNNFRQKFFGKKASVDWNIKRLKKLYKNYIHKNIDIRKYFTLEKLFKTYNKDIKLIIHTAAQPSHDWAASNPILDFKVNANATLNLLELTRLHCPKAVFIFTSTNKVYGDNPNKLPFRELKTRWEVKTSHKYFKKGIC